MSIVYLKTGHTVPKTLNKRKDFLNQNWKGEPNSLTAVGARQDS